MLVDAELFNLEGMIFEKEHSFYEDEQWEESLRSWHDRDGGVAQLGEHLLCKQGVVGSNPFISTKD